MRARAGAEARLEELNRQGDEQRQLRAAVEIASRAAVVAPLAESATKFKTQRDQAATAHAELVESLESREEIESTGTPELKALRGRFESNLRSSPISNETNWPNGADSRGSS